MDSFIPLENHTVMHMVSSQKVKLLEKSITVENELYRPDLVFKKNLNKLYKIRNEKFLDLLIELRLEGISLSRLNRYIIVYFKYLDDLEFENITINQVRNIFLEIKLNNLAGETKKNEWIICKKVFRYLELNVDFGNFKLKLKKKRISYDDLLSKKEKSLILASKMNLEKKAFFVILANTGLRVGEVFSINRGSIKKIEDGYLVTTNKSKTKNRTVFIFKDIKYINRLLKTNWEHWEFSYDMIRKVLKRFEKKFGKRLYCHLMRHTKATQMLEAGLPIKTLQYYFGWSSSKMLFDTYAHVNEKKALEEVIEYEKKS